MPKPLARNLSVLVVKEACFSGSMPQAVSALCSALELASAGKSSMHIQTSRLILREFCWDDLASIYAYQSDPLVVQYVCYGPSTLHECRDDLAFHIKQQTSQARTFYHFALALPASSESIGWCGLDLGEPNHREGELGYALHQAYWGRGYITEAACALLAFGFQRLHLHRIYGTCHPANTGSIGVMTKLRMRYEGCLREHRWCKGAWRDSHIYALLEHEWQAADKQQAP
jgi:RimJ/RimL family protein N-acetyltransferase